VNLKKYSKHVKYDKFTQEHDSAPSAKTRFKSTHFSEHSYDLSATYTNGGSQRDKKDLELVQVLQLGDR
jgi:hypothetical protein